MSDIFQISRTGIQTASRATEVVANNIANVNTPGFSRQQSVITQRSVNRVNMDSGGVGVNFSEVRRMRDVATDQQIQQKESQFGELSQKIRVYQVMEQSFISSSGIGLDALIGEFFTSFSNLATNPADTNQRNLVLSKAQTLTTQFNTLDAKLKDLSNSTLSSIRSQTEQVTASLSLLADINRSLANSPSGTSAQGALLDKQTVELRNLSKLTGIDVNDAGNNQVEIRIGGLLVLSTDGAATIRAEVDTSTQSVYLRLDNGRVIQPRNGELAGTISLYSTDISGIRTQLDQLAGSLVDSVNELHRNGYGLNDAEVRNFFNVTSDTVGRTAGSMVISTAILNQPQNIAASSVPGERGNSTNAVALANLLNQPMSNGRSLIDQSIELISEPGLRLNQLKVQQDVTASSREMLIRQQDDLAGVNMDEELSMLIKYQNAYQASARVMSVAQEMQNVLLNLI